MIDVERKNLDQFTSDDKFSQMHLARRVVRGRFVELIFFMIILIVTFVSFAL
jgi:hypothetical protein